MTTVNILNADISADGIDIDKTEISSPTDQELILNETIDTKLDEQSDVIQIVDVYDKEENQIEIVNRQIKERIKTLLNKMYNIKIDSSIKKPYYFIYHKPTYSYNWLKNDLLFILYQLDFNIQHQLYGNTSNKYYLTTLCIEGDTIYVDAHSPQEVVKMKTNLEFWFNSIDDVKIIINKAYYDCDFVKTEA